MLAIRLQRLGRKGYPVYRMAVQESQRHPSSGRVVAYVGAYNPHTKEVKLNTEKVAYYLKNGAQPTSRVVRLLDAQKVALPAWVTKPTAGKTATIRKPEKLRKNQLKQEVVAEEAQTAPAGQPADQASQENTES